jgi:hypothetical protein
MAITRGRIDFLQYIVPGTVQYSTVQYDAIEGILLEKNSKPKLKM